MSSGQRANQGGLLGSNPLRSDGSREVRREAGPGEQWPKDTQGKPKTQGGPPGPGPLRSDGSRGSQAGRLDHIIGGQRCSRKSRKTTSSSQGTY